MEPLTLLWILLVIAAVVIIGLVAVPYLVKKGIINKKNISSINQMLDFAELAVSNIKNDKARTIEIILNIAQKVVHYVEQTMTNEDNKEKKKFAVDATKDILKQLNVEIDANNEKLIELGIESAVNVLPKTNKTP